MAPSSVLRSAAGRVVWYKGLLSGTRRFATAIPAKAHHRIVVVGGGTAGVTVAAQLQRLGPELSKPDIAILDPATTHHYQVSICPVSSIVPLSL
jgi:NADPH-dependent 2,4-dienoyl-CoA reductase/sulfur reductase-like enzyme